MDGGDLTDLRWLSTMNLRVVSLDQDEAAGAGHAGCSRTQQTALAAVLAELEALPADAVDVTARAPCSFPALIALALAHAPTGKMALNEICAWIARTFAFFATGKHSAWKASVRQNLSSNKIFSRSGPASSSSSSSSSGTGSSNSSKATTCHWTLTPAACDAIATRAPVLAPRRPLVHLSPLQVRKRGLDASHANTLCSSDMVVKRTRGSLGAAIRASDSDCTSVLSEDTRRDESDSCASLLGDESPSDAIFGDLSLQMFDLDATQCALFAPPDSAIWDHALLDII
eukprot:m.20298 g.20298  ORF g.20298 m.20298 type:complete len:286 (-) comp7791_c0_seq1:34-891(-)